MADRFLIAPLQKGQQNNITPWLIPDEAFAQLKNAYVFRGRIRKRFGSFLLGSSPLLSRLRINLGDTSASPFNIATITGASSAQLGLGVGQMFSIGNDVFTVPGTGTPIQLLTTSGTITATLDTTSTVLTLTGANPGTNVYFYPAKPVMGIRTREVTTNINDEQTVAFDTRFAYIYSSGWTRIATETNPGDALWTGTDSQFFWTTNWRGSQNYESYLFVTNFNSTDRIRFLDPTTTWHTLGAQYDATGTNVINSCRIILPFKGRLLLLNTIEYVTAAGDNKSFVNRCRFSQNGDPTAADAWRQDIVGKGSYIEAATTEAIISAEFLKDRLIVYFERSTWELVGTENEVNPFYWQKINTELGVESTFSIVPFDKAVLGVGNVGIHACSGANVERIDDLIPDEVFEVSNSNEGVQRVYGIRDYYTELVYWAFPSADTAATTYPNRIFVYNYSTQTWAFNDDSITCFGYFQNPLGLTWEEITWTWAEWDGPWVSASLNAKFRQVLAGNQQGWTFICAPDAPARNAAALQITGVTGPVLGIVTLTVVDHNLTIGDYIYIENCSGSTELNNTVFQVLSTPTTNTFAISYTGASVTAYKGAGTVARVSQIDIYTKQYNFYVKDGRNASINKIDWLLDRTSRGEITIDYYLSSGNASLNLSGTFTGALVDTGALQTYPYDLVPFEGQQDRLWHTTYPITNGECIQMRIYLSDSQMKNTDIAFSDFTLHAFMIHSMPTASRLQ